MKQMQSLKSTQKSEQLQAQKGDTSSATNSNEIWEYITRRSQIEEIQSKMMHINNDSEYYRQSPDLFELETNPFSSIAAAGADSQNFMHGIQTANNKQAGSCEILETIQEEDDEIQFCMQVEKLSTSGIMFNKRVLSIDSDTLSYYAPFAIPGDKKINMFKHCAKVRISLKDIESIAIVAHDKSHLLKVAGVGATVRKGKLLSKPTPFAYTFRFHEEAQALLWRKLILTAQQAVKSKSYLLTFDNLIKLKHSNSS